MVSFGKDLAQQKVDFTPVAVKLCLDYTTASKNYSIAPHRRSIDSAERDRELLLRLNFRDSRDFCNHRLTSLHQMGKEHALNALALISKSFDDFLDFLSLFHHNSLRPKDLFTSLQSKGSDPHLHGPCIRSQTFVFFTLTPSDRLLLLRFRALFTT